MITFSEVRSRQLRDEFANVLHETSFVKWIDFATGADYENKEKNRYPGYNALLPLEQTRVKLKWGNELSSDYINANYITGETKEKQYILTQAPLPNTIPDFWMMIAQEKTPVVVMLTNLIEKEAVRADRYWPKKNEKLQVGKYQIEKINTIKEETFSTRFLRLTSLEKDESREVVQFHYKKWPEYVYPYQTEGIHQLIAKIDSESKRLRIEGLEGPITIHCSGGIDRSGVLSIALIAINRFKADDPVNIAEILRQVRNERYGVIQRVKEYELIHYLYEEAVMRINYEEVPNIDYLEMEEPKKVFQEEEEPKNVYVEAENPGRDDSCCLM